MSRYFFDVCDDGRVTRDEEGAEFNGIDAAVDEASRTMGEIARASLPRSTQREMTIYLRDENRRLRLRAELRFEATRF